MIDALRQDEASAAVPSCLSHISRDLTGTAAKEKLSVQTPEAATIAAAQRALDELNVRIEQTAEARTAAEQELAGVRHLRSTLLQRQAAGETRG